MRRLIAWSAFGLAFTQFIFLSTNLLILMDSADIDLRTALGANFVVAALLFILPALLVAVIARSRLPRIPPATLALGALIVAASVMTSHAASRIENRVPLVILTALHQAATTIWVGGLPYLWLALKKSTDATSARKMCMNFSRVAMICVACLAVSGLALAGAYVGSWSALYGTSHGAMVATKAVLFACLLFLGGQNYRIVRDLASDDGRFLLSLRRFAEAEIGIALTVIFVAASLTSQPPAVDLTVGRASASEVAARIAPGWPRLHSPALETLNLPTLHAALERAAGGYSSISAYAPGDKPALPPGPGDIAWSEYNHNWSGLIVLALGVMAFLAHTGKVPLAKHWPLVFLALAVFLFVRSDPENWPLGPNSFWASFADPEVLQHRIAVLLVVAFAFFEWRVQTRPANAGATALVFPGVCAIGGALLMTHSHALGNIKQEVLVELTHLPLGILAVVAGWSRWLEVRLPGENRLRPALSWVWPVCFILIGAILLNYREA